MFCAEVSIAHQQHTPLAYVQMVVSFAATI